MFVNIMQFPPIPADRDEDFRRWFSMSNEQYAKHPGFIRRRLLKSRKQGTYTAIIEHESYETFMTMHKSRDQANASNHLKTVLAEGPTAQFYELVEG